MDGIKYRMIKRRAFLMKDKQRRHQRIAWERQQNIQDKLALEQEFRQADKQRRAYQMAKKQRKKMRDRRDHKSSTNTKKTNQCRKRFCNTSCVETNVKRLRIDRVKAADKQSCAERLKYRQRYQAVMKELKHNASKPKVSDDDYVLIDNKETPGIMSYIMSWFF